MTERSPGPYTNFQFKVDGKSYRVCLWNSTDIALFIGVRRHTGTERAVMPDGKVGKLLIAIALRERALAQHAQSAALAATAQPSA